MVGWNIPDQNELDGYIVHSINVRQADHLKYPSPDMSIKMIVNIQNELTDFCLQGIVNTQNVCSWSCDPFSMMKQYVMSIELYYSKLHVFTIIVYC